MDRQSPSWKRPEVRDTKLLEYTIRKGNLDQVSEWIGGSLDTEQHLPFDDVDLTPLIVAIRCNSLDAVRLFLKAGARTDRMAISHLEADGAKIFGLPNDRPFHKEIYAPLMYAAAVGNNLIVEELLASGADVNQTGVTGMTALMAASAFNKPATVRLLLAKGAEVNAALQDVPYLKNSLVEALGVSGDNPRNKVHGSFSWPTSGASYFRPTSGASALWMATFSRSKESVVALLAAGADRTATASCAEIPAAPAGEEPCTPARLAEILEYSEISALLGASGAEKPSTVVMRTRTAEERADLAEKLSFILSQDHPEALRPYLEGGYQLNDELGGADRGATLLEAAAREGAAKIIRFLIAAGADVNRKSSRNGVPLVTALAAAAANYAKGEECVSILLDAGARVNEPGTDAFPPIAYAVAEGKAETLKKLVAAGADVNVRFQLPDPHRIFRPGETPLYLAARRGLTEHVRVLLDAGADPRVEVPCDAASETACTPRRIAELSRRTDIVAMLDAALGSAPGVVEEDLLDPKLSRKAFSKRLKAIISLGQIDKLRALLDRGLDADSLIGQGSALPILSVAALSNQEAMVDLLLKRGANPNRMSWRKFLETDGYKGFGMSPTDGEDDLSGAFEAYSPLMYAASHGPGVVDLLLRAGADVHRTGIGGATPLMIAAEFNQARTVRRLIEAGGEVEASAVNRQQERHLRPHGATALWLGCAEGAAEAVTALLDAGADPTVEAACTPVSDSRDKPCDCRSVAKVRGMRNVVLLLERRLHPR